MCWFYGQNEIEGITQEQVIDHLGKAPNLTQQKLLAGL